MHKPITSVRHHWWPESLSRFWEGSDGFASRLSWDGKLVRTVPAHFGVINDAHNIKFAGTPTAWDESFESAFDHADGRFPVVVEWLLTLESKHRSPDGEFEERLEAQQAPAEMVDDLTTCLISLIVRSPRFRNSVRSRVERLRSDMGLTDPEAEDGLIGINMRNCQQQFSRAIGGRGKFAVLFTDSREFTFGDGFLHNFSSTTHIPLSPRWLIPLTPTICILYARPLSYLTEPRLMTMQLTPDEVRFVNCTVQVYSRDYIFFRSQQPEIIAEFSRREFRQYPHHRHDGLDALISAMIDTYFKATCRSCRGIGGC